MVFAAIIFAFLRHFFAFVKPAAFFTLVNYFSLKIFFIDHLSSPRRFQLPYKPHDKQDESHQHEDPVNPSEEHHARPVRAVHQAHHSAVSVASKSHHAESAEEYNDRYCNQNPPNRFAVFHLFHLRCFYFHSTIKVPVPMPIEHAKRKVPFLFGVNST